MTELAISRNKRLIRKRVLDKFGREAIEAKRAELCRQCTSWDHGRCVWDLLPFQSDGERCSYFGAAAPVITVLEGTREAA